MGTNTLVPASAGAIDTDDINQLITALLGDFYPRNASSGALEGGQHSLGSSAVAWKNAFINNLYINGILFDPSGTGGVTDTANAVLSGATRSTSALPDFLRATGTDASFTILGATTALTFSANNNTVSIETDLLVSSLTVAPSTENTCLVDMVRFDDTEFTKYYGGEGESITISDAGTEITDRVGQFVCFLTPDGEYFMAYIESETEIKDCYRGFFFDDNGDPIERTTLADDDTLTLMSLGWIFADANGTTIDVSYRSPYFGGREPVSPTTDDYMFDFENNYWLRYSGSDWEQVDRTLIGWCVVDENYCVATRSLDITQTYYSTNSLDLKYYDADIVKTNKGVASISVYGKPLVWTDSPVTWDITADLETGLTEAIETVYYLYITELGQQVISDVRPYDATEQLRGYYHPYESWRCVGIMYNNSDGDIDNVINAAVENGRYVREEVSATGYILRPFGAKLGFTHLVGAGGGGSLYQITSGTALAGGGNGGAGFRELLPIDLFDFKNELTIGAGGTGATASGYGTAGGNSQLKLDNENYIITSAGGTYGKYGGTTSSTVRNMPSPAAVSITKYNDDGISGTITPDTITGYIPYISSSDIGKTVSTLFLNRSKGGAGYFYAYLTSTSYTAITTLPKDSLNGGGAGQAVSTTSTLLTLGGSAFAGNGGHGITYTNSQGYTEAGDGEFPGGGGGGSGTSSYAAGDGADGNCDIIFM